jgi:hypothetical protein
MLGAYKDRSVSSRAASADIVDRRSGENAPWGAFVPGIRSSHYLTYPMGTTSGGSGIASLVYIERIPSM